MLHPRLEHPLVLVLGVLTASLLASMVTAMHGDCSGRGSTCKGINPKEKKLLKLPHD